MSFINYAFRRLMYKLTNNREFINDFYRKEGVKIGSNSIICSYTKISEPCLVEIGDDCVVSSNVAFVTHDHSINKVCEKSNLFGKIKIGNNCFIGQGAMLLYGVELADNIIVASGSVVTKSFHEHDIIVGGNPAKKISTWNEFRKKNADKAAYRYELQNILRGEDDKLISR